MSQEIEYSEKYADDEFEYRCSARLSAPARALALDACSEDELHVSSHVLSLRAEQSRHLAQAHCQDCTQGAAAE